MFQLERVSIHGWYLLEDRDIEVTGSVALIGQTGAGKSAVVDAIQTVMSGNNRNVIKLNSAAGETRDRRVVDYCLGCVTDVDDGRPMRQSSETVLALTFVRRDTGVRVAFGVLLSAHADEPNGERTAERFVVKGQGFRLADFVDQEPNGARFMPGHDVLLARMKERFGVRRNAFTLHSTARAFVQEYLTAMRPKASPDPNRFLATFSNALAAREIKNPTDFVRRFVLEPNPLNIKRVRESIATWRDLQAEAHRLEEMLSAAREVRSRFAAWARHKLVKDGAEFLAAHAERLRLDIEICENEASKKALKKQLRDIEVQELKLSDEDIRLADENRRDALIAAKSETAVSRELLESAARAALQAGSAGAAQLTRSLAPYNEAIQLARLTEHLPAWTSEGIHAAAALADIVKSGKPERWAPRWAEIGALAASVLVLRRADQSLQPQHDAAVSDLAAWRREQADLDARIAAASQAGSLMSAQTVRFREELAARGIAAAAMPDIVEVPDERWAFALEALLGAHREALIVSADRLDEAFRILFRNRGQLDGCRLINTRKTRASHPRVPAGSIAEAAVTNDPDARAFIDSHVGRYIRAEDEHELSRLDQGVMSNGKTSQGLGLRVFRERPSILGRTAQAAARETALARRVEVIALIAAGERQKALLQSGLRVLSALEGAAPPVDIEADARGLADAMERLASARDQSAKLDMAEPNGIVEVMRKRDQRMHSNKLEMEELRRRAVKTHETLGGLESASIEKVGKTARLLLREDELSSAQATEREKWLIDISVGEPITAIRERLENKLLLKWIGREAAELRREEAEARQLFIVSGGQIEETRRRADGELRRYLVDIERGETLAGDADEAEKLIWINRRVIRIEAHELLPHRKLLEEARGEMERMLKEDLLAKLDERLQSASHQIGILNRRLKDHTFVGQTYSFNRRPNERMRPLAELARYVAADPRLDFEALQRAELSPSLRSALDDIERVVGTEADVSELEDYRTYYEYDLLLRQGEEKPVSFASVLGKLSGGQRQAPYYVAIAASMVSVYFPGGRVGDTEGMGLVLFDEAFNQLDVKNTRALLELFRKLGLQVVVAAPEINRSTFLESVDTIVTVARQPNTPDIYLDVMRPGPRAREAMRAANPEHTGVGGFRAAAAAALASVQPDAAAAD